MFLVLSFLRVSRGCGLTRPRQLSWLRCVFGFRGIHPVWGRTRQGSFDSRLVYSGDRGCTGSTGYRDCIDYKGYSLQTSWAQRGAIPAPVSILTIIQFRYHYLSL